MLRLPSQSITANTARQRAVLPVIFSGHGLAQSAPAGRARACTSAAAAATLASAPPTSSPRLDTFDPAALAIARQPAAARAPLNPSSQGAAHSARSEGTAPAALLADAADFYAAYLLGEHLGEGSFGSVRVAVHKASGATHAVKSVALRRASGENALDTILAEVTAWRAVQESSASVARLHAAYRDNAAGCVLLLQQLCEGGDMQTLLDTHGPLSESDAASAIEGVLSSLAACHAAGYCYGDVKPANYMLPAMWPSVLHLANPEAPKGQLTTVAIDFGCAQECAQGCSLHSLSGTPFYMAPEMLTEGEEETSLGVDVWAAGVMLYHMITGRFPAWPDLDMARLGRLSPRRVISDIAAFVVVDLSHPTCAHLSPELKRLLRAMLQRDPAERISAADALAHPWLTAHMQQQ